MLTGPINPTITSFDLDLDSDQLTFHFDTAVDVSTFVTSRVTLVNESSINSDTFQLQLSNSTVIAQGIQQDFRILLSTSNVIDIKRNPLCYTADNCFAMFAEGVAISEDDLTSQASSSPLQVSILQQDVTPPRFHSFPVFDLNSGFFTVFFSEPINGSSTDFTQVQFGNKMSDPTEIVTLNGGYTSPDHVELDFHLTTNDLNLIKYHPNLCTQVSNCWLKLPSFVFTDIGSNPFLHSNYQPGAVASFHKPTVFVSDTTSPLLTEISVDMHTGKLLLRFNEVIDETDFLPSDVTVLNEPAGEVSLILSNITDFSVKENQTALEMSLTQEDLNWIKSRNMFSSIADSFISLVTTMTDVSGNKFTDIQTNEAKQATEFIRDNRPATLLSFELFNIDNGSFILSFDEPMNDTSFNPAAITIASSDGGNGQLFYQLTDGSAVAINNERTLVMVILSTIDRVAIKLTSGLAKNDANTFIALENSAFVDAFDNFNQEVALSAPVRLTGGKYVIDTSPSTLASAAIDMNIGVLTLNFDDVIDAETFEPGFITIQNQSDITASTSYTLDSSIVASESSNIMKVNISEADTLALKSQLHLAKSIEDTYISFSTSIARDIEGRLLIAVPSINALQVNSYINDFTPPKLTSYNLDIDSGVMMMTFNEPVLLSSYTPSGLRFQDTVTTPSATYTLQGGELQPQSDSAAADIKLSLQLSFSDLNEVKSNTNLATAQTNAYIGVDPSFITDTSNNGIESVTGLNSANYLPDITLPELEESILDMTDGGKLILRFSEAVQYTPKFLSSVRLQSSITSPIATIIVLQNGVEMATKTDLHEITITLSNVNTNKILNDDTIASTTSNAFVSLDTGGVYDYSQGGVGQSLVSVTKRVSYMYILCFTQNTYNNIETGTCDSCSSVCVGGCTGGGSFVGEGGCSLCDVIKVDENVDQVNCLAINSECSDTDYSDSNTVFTGLTSNGHLCRPCHEDCATCSGPGSDNCDSCQTALQLNGAAIVQCLTSCSQGSTDCYYCHPECDGCIGPSNTDCISCKGQSQQNSDGQTVCVPSCSDDEYLAVTGDEFICVPCHKECIGCTGPSNSECKLCQNYNNTIIAGLSECSPRCLFGTYADDSNTCKHCDPQCDGCSGPSSSNCTGCVEDSLSSTGGTICVPTCPYLQEYDISGKSCALSQTGQTIVIAVCCSFGVLLIVAVVLFAFCCVCKCKRKYSDDFGDLNLNLVGSKGTHSDKVSFIRSSSLFHTTSKM